MNSDEIETLAAAIAEKLTNARNERLWTPDDVAAYLSVCRRQVVNRYARRPDFPQPLQLPTETGRGELRWPRQAIIEWAEGGGLEKYSRRAA